MPRAVLGGHDLFWREMGQGGDAALLLHCSMAHGRAWAGVMAALGHRLRAVAPDLPGHGQSADLPDGADFHDTATGAVLPLLQDGAPKTVIGHSFGATVALRLALEHPDLVSRLILIEPVLFAAARGYDSFPAYQAMMAPFHAAVAEGRRDEAADLFMADWGTGQAWADLPEGQRAYIRDRIHIITEGDRALVPDTPAILRGDRLEHHRIPTLLIEGGASPRIVHDIADVFQARMPTLERARVEGAGHMLPITHVRPVSAEIAAFLDRHPVA